MVKKNKEQKNKKGTISPDLLVPKGEKYKSSSLLGPSGFLLGWLEMEEEERKWMRYAIITICDVLKYQNGEQLDEHLDFLADSLEEIVEAGKYFTEEDYEKLYNSLFERNLESMPITKKAKELYEK